MTFWQGLSAWTQGVLIGALVVAPVGYYSITKFGSVLWTDFTTLVSTVWTSLKSKV